MLYQGRALQPGTEGAATTGAGYWTWWLRSSLAVVIAGAAGSLLIAGPTWLALRLGATAVLPVLTGTRTAVGSAPVSEVAAGWSLAFFSSQLVPVQLWSASPPGLAFGLGSPLLLALLVAVSFRAGLRLEGASSGEFSQPEARVRAAAVAVPQALLVLAMLALARLGSGPLAGAPVAGAAILPVLVVAGSAAAGAIWRRERRLGRGAAAGARGLALAALALAAACVLTACLALVALVVAVATGQVRVGGGLGTVLLGLVYLPNAGVLAAASGLGGGPSLGAGLEAGLCLLLTAACFGIALILRRRRDHLEQIFFAAGFPILLLLAAVCSRPLVSDHTLGFNPGVAFWVAAVVSSMAAAAGPSLAETRLGDRLAGGPLLGLLTDWVPPVPEASAAPTSATSEVARSHSQLMGRLVLVFTAVVMLGLVTLVIVVPAPSVASGPEQTIGEYLRLESAGDAAGLWPRLRIDRTALPAGTDSSFLTQAGLAATLAARPGGGGAPSGLQVKATRRSLAGTEYSAVYVQDGQRRQRLVTLQSERVLVVPEILSLAPAPGLGTVTLDGTSVTDPRRQLAVIPGAHELRSSGSGLWQPAQIRVPAPADGTRPVPVSLRPTLTPSALGLAAAAVGEAFTGCVTATVSAPPGCPQSLPGSPGGPVAWELVGDPVAGAAFAGTDDVTVVATGNFQMIGSYAVHIPEGVRHQPSSGGYRLSLSWTGQAFSRGDLAAAEGPAGARPAVPESALLEAVAAGFRACLASNLLRPPDCPQAVASTLFISKVVWSADADPLGGATVSYDPSHSIFLIAGQFSMSVRYEAGTKPASSSSSGAYRAELFWDGSKPVLVDIVKS